MEIINKLGKELDDFTIYDNFIKKSSITGYPIEYLIIGLNNHYYAISLYSYYVISEIEEPTRTAYQRSNKCDLFTKKGLIEHLRKLKIMVQ